MNTVQLVRQELGNNISATRLDLEVDLRANSKSDTLEQSAVYQQLSENDSSLAKNYVKAIAHVASTYKNLSDRNTPDNKRWASKLVNSHLAVITRTRK